MKSPILIMVALLAGCSTPTTKNLSPFVNPPLSVEEKKIIAICESEIEKVMSGQAKQTDKHPVYSAYERTSLMHKCLESQGIPDERISDIFSILEREPSNSALH